VTKICAVKGCEIPLPAWRIYDTLCHEHGEQTAKKQRKRGHDPEAVEKFQRELREAALLSLIQDPSRWTWESSACDGGMEGRARPRVRDPNCCPGWMCGTHLDAPILPGQYCSLECKQQTLQARQEFRRELSELSHDPLPHRIT